MSRTSRMGTLFRNSPPKEAPTQTFTMMSSLEARVEICENERLWIGGGFSKKGLLPNDRGRYSSLDGSLSWKTIEEAEATLLDKGWVYLDDDQFSPEVEGGDGWLYSRDFSKSAMDNAKATKGALQWVRFRRLVRRKMFDPHQFVPPDVASKCEHCDSKATESLSNLILEVISFLTMVQSPSVLTEAVALPIKSQILDMVHPSNNTHLPGTTAMARLDALHKILEMHADSERNAMKHIFSLMGAFYERRKDPGFAGRCDAISERILTPPERDLISRLLVRAYDPEFQLHCDKENCGDACEFVRVPCSNVGCREVMSKVYLPAHDPTCPYKLISCECGDSFPQQLKLKHLAEVCPLREQNCPFAAVGCTKVTQAKDISDHVAEETGSHLLLTLNRLTEVQTVIRNLNDKVRRLEEENSQLRADLGSYRDGSANESRAVDKKLVALGKKVATLESTSRKEFKRIRDHSRERARSHVK